eukprot:Rhum_TRINITY_DN13493_c1_g1::Rhum_TRINITY_DN13493_c1_g1_i1::g.60462::m.60462
MPARPRLPKTGLSGGVPYRTPFTTDLTLHVTSTIPGGQPSFSVSGINPAKVTVFEFVEHLSRLVGRDSSSVVVTIRGKPCASADTRFISVAGVKSANTPISIGLAQNAPPAHAASPPQAWAGSPHTNYATPAVPPQHQPQPSPQQYLPHPQNPQQYQPPPPQQQQPPQYQQQPPPPLPQQPQQLQYQQQQ